MKLSITIPQKQFFDYGDKFEIYEEVKNSKKEIVKRKLELDLIDLSLFDYLFYACNADWTTKFKHNYTTFSWLSYQKIIEDNPQLRIKNKRNIANRIQKLSKFKLLNLYINKEDGNKTYFAIPSEIYEYFTIGKSIVLKAERGVENIQGMHSEIHTPMHSKTQRVCTQEYNNSYIKRDSEIKEDNNKEKKVTKKEKTLINSQTRELLNNLGVDESFANQLIDYRKEIGAPFKSAYGLNSLLNQYLQTKLKLKVSVDKIFEIQSGHEWQSIKKEWIERELKEEKKERANENRPLDLSKFGFDKPKDNEEFDFLNPPTTDRETFDITKTFLIGG